MRRLTLAVACAAAGGLGVVAAQSGSEKAPEQPIPFSHKVHSGIGIQCLDCHPIRGEGFAAGFPKVSSCMGCHMVVNKQTPAIRKMTRFAKEKRPVPWVRVYEIPQYVWFSHEAHHTDAKIGCETCHGPVATRDVITKEKPTSMASCMDCHAKHRASNACDLCHDPL